MIWVSRKEELRRILLALSSKSLEFLGVFNFIVKDKKIIKLYRSSGKHYRVLLAEESGKFESIIETSKAKYEKLRKEAPFGQCGVVQHSKHNNIIYITDKLSPDSAINQIILLGWAKMMFLLIVMGLFFAGLLILLSPLFY